MIEDQEDEVSEPEEGDITTPDHCNFYQDGKLAFTVDIDASTDEMWAAIQAHMKKDQFFPNIYWISDHGNAHLMSQ